MSITLSMLVLLTAGSLQSEKGGGPSPHVELVVTEVRSSGFVASPTFLVSIINRGMTAPLWINSRFSLNDKDAPVSLYEVWLEVTEVGGKEALPFLCAARSSPARIADYVRVGPGRAIGALVNGACYQMKQDRTYTIVAHWHDSGRFSGGVPHGAVPLKQELTSAPITIKP